MRRRSSNDDREDATVRLVRALNPDADEASLDLARRILESQLGGGTLEANNDGSSSRLLLSSIWKQRIQNQRGEQGSHQHDIEQLYQTLVQMTTTTTTTTTTSRSHPDLPAKIMTVLTKLIHHHQNSNANANASSQQQQPYSTSNRQNQTTRSRMDLDDARAYASANANPSQSFHAMQYEEEQVLRELLYALQGMEGERIKFFHCNDDDDDDDDDNNTTNAVYDEAQTKEHHHSSYPGIRVLSPALAFQNNHHYQNQQSPSHSILGSGAMDALRLCGEAGWLVRRLQKYVDDRHVHHKNKNNNASSSSGSGGRVARALAQSVAQELQSYHDTLAYWDEQQQQQQQQSSSLHNNNNNNNNTTTTRHQWSLRQWWVQLQGGCLQRLTVLGILTEALPQGNGGTLLSALYLHSLHGDVRHKSLVQSILYPTSKPWFHMLYLWTTQGLLPAAWGHDFFVTLQEDYHSNHALDNDNNNNNDNKYLWHDKYTLVKAQIPHAGIFDPALVRPAFVVGKGINFIRTCLHQVGWTLHLEEDEAEDDEHEGGRNGQTTKSTKTTKDDYSEEAIMERWGYHYVAEPMGMHLNPRLTKTLQRAEKIVHSHILTSLRQDHNLLNHLFSLKQFLFHGQGDFFSSLLESLYNEFGCGTRPRQNVNTSFVTGHAVAGVYPQQLVAMMEAALRTTNAKGLPPFCLERLTVEMLPWEPDETPPVGHGLFTTPLRNLAEQTEAEENHTNMSHQQAEDNRTVWDIFMLDYTVPDPLVAIVHEKAMEQYKLVYSFLFGLRKVEYMLNSTWRQSATLQHALQVMAQNNGLQVTTSVGFAHATVLLRKIAMTRQAMTHFCVNLKSYCMLEVLEGGWKQLLGRLEHAQTLDEAIQAHDHYLEGICRKCLLVKGRKNRRRSRVDERPRNNKFAQLFRVILSIATEFCALQERLFDDALEAAERVAQRRREAEQRMTHGQWGFENESDLAEEESFFGLADSKELQEVVRLAEAFHQCMQTLLEALDAKVNGRSRNMSTTSITEDNDDDDEDIWDAQRDHGDLTADVAPFFIDSGEEDDIDSLRFLMFQLDHNGYYQLNPGER